MRTLLFVFPLVFPMFYFVFLLFMLSLVICLSFLSLLSIPLSYWCGCYLSFFSDSLERSYADVECCVSASAVCVCVCNERDILLETPVWQEPETDHHLVDLIPTEKGSVCWVKERVIGNRIRERKKLTSVKRNWSYSSFLQFDLNLFFMFPCLFLLTFVAHLMV